MQTYSPGFTVSSISASATASSGPVLNTFETPLSSATGEAACWRAVVTNDVSCSPW